MTDFLARKITLAFGNGRDAKTWHNETRGTVDQFLTWLEDADPKAHQKDGVAFLQGALRQGQTARHNKYMEAMEISAFDVESGEAPEPIAENAKKLGIEIVIYPTFNCDKPETRLSTDAVHQHAKLGLHDEATAEQVLAFLRDKKGYLPWVMETAKFEGRDEREYVVSHAPLPRFRVVAVWREPVKLSALSPTAAGAKQRWETVYRAVAAKLGIQHFDESCTDLCRLFYAHRRPNDAKHWSIRVKGDALDFAVVLAEAAATEVPPEEPQRGENKSNGGAYQTPKLGKFFARCAEYFKMADFLAIYGDDSAEANGGVAARCPNEDAHSEIDPPGKRPLWALNAADADRGVFVVKCQHETCKRTLKSGHYVDLLCQAHGLTVEDLVRDFVDEEGRASWEDDAGNFSVDDTGKPYPTQHNIKVALRKLGVSLSFDEFAGKTIIRRDEKEEILQDHHVVDVWLEIERTHHFKPGKDYFFDVAGSVAREESFHPVRDYLASVEAQWDGVPRVSKLFSAYFGAVNTAFNRAASKCWFVAAVRRIRQPGCKFDEMIVTESPQGKGKSSAFAVLALRPEWFSDNLALGAKSKEVIELTQGKWIIEIAELHGMRKAEIERVKAQLSRQFDEARLAYGRLPEHVPRSFVFCGTSNNKSYLKDTTGNRRFWPIETGDIDLAALKRDVDQLWGEAATLEAAGESIRLDKSLWGAAAEAQEQRQIENPYLDVLAIHFADIDGRVRSSCVYELLGIPLERRSQTIIEQVNAAMQKLGWEKKTSLRLHDKIANGFGKKTKVGKDPVWQATGFAGKLQKADPPSGSNKPPSAQHGRAVLEAFLDKHRRGAL